MYWSLIVVRDLNILRIGFVASLITKCGGAVICAPIAPYANIRDKVRNFKWSFLIAQGA